jgi:hypothetical protein
MLSAQTVLTGRELRYCRTGRILSDILISLVSGDSVIIKMGENNIYLYGFYDSFDVLPDENMGLIRRSGRGLCPDHYYMHAVSGIQPQVNRKGAPYRFDGMSPEITLLHRNRSYTEVPREGGNYRGRYTRNQWMKTRNCTFAGYTR